jgi:Cell wall-associated hydrolases (invasion-associated proteins)
MGVVTASIGIVVPAAHADDYPSWNDVQQAKRNVANQQAMVDKILGLINGLQSQVDAARIEAAKDAEIYLEAKQQLSDATERAHSLQKQATAAQKTADTSKLRAGLLASHLVRAGGQDPTVELLLKGGDASGADGLLYQLGTMSKLTQQSKEIYDRAISDKNAAQSLTDQAKAAEKVRTELAGKAQDALNAANAAQQAAQQALTVQQQKSTQLIAQLATLKSVSEQKANAFAAGQLKAKQEAEAAAARKRLAEEQAAKHRPPASSGGGGGSSGGGAPSGSKVAGAIAFAEAQLGDPYVMDGAGPNVWDCSGLTMMAYASVGVDIGGHGVIYQYDTMQAEGRLVSYSQRQPGDLLYWYSGGVMYHTAIYLGNDMMIAAPTEGDVVKIQPVWGYGGDLMNVVGRPTG